MTLCGKLSCGLTCQSHRKVKEAVDRNGTETQRSVYFKEEGKSCPSLTRFTGDLVTAQGKFLYSLECICVWVSDI